MLWCDPANTTAVEEKEAACLLYQQVMEIYIGLVNILAAGTGEKETTIGEVKGIPFALPSVGARRWKRPSETKEIEHDSGKTAADSLAYRRLSRYDLLIK